ncbi:glucan 1,4-alpha-glucosidase [Halomicroarcula sp. F13]|uniref:Glucan 1,4-alpha-glucosidase n=1 Tax=Haloarcula rubra TaxID=2487747 RepID=A0AAW4PRN3_9EURY|nr:glycoside hydrolase family 15 protein [Halomicroarcula rubra]MBX0322957.1 glucan 1,4-alpha-glucosidase [Halomicroarcula rubra]
MTLRTSLDDFKRHRDADRKFPGELRSTTGLFAGQGDRLVHVDADGSLRDYSYPLSGLSGIDASRFGVGDDWFDADADQRYRGETGVVETVHDNGQWGVVQQDLTLGRAHVTRFELDGDAPSDLDLRAYVRFAPDGREGQTSLLVHDDAVEAYHRREHDYVGVSTDLSGAHGQIPERFDELVADDPVDFPRTTDEERYEDEVLTAGVLVTAPFEDGSVTLVTLLAERGETDREAALSRLDDVAGDGAALTAASERRRDWEVPRTVAHRETVVDDLRVVSMLSAENGARIAGPDFDPFYVTSGGYGYTWFRDDAEISRFLLDGSEALGVDLSHWHQRSAEFYCRTQLDDGSWPHRVWPGDETLAPGWANARIESGTDTDYQADQSGSVAGFLATFLRTGDPDDPERVEAAIERAVESLDDTLEADGLPVACQNAWENMQGRFVHTAATFLHAYAAVARAPVSTDLRDHARAQADTVVEGLDRLWTGEFYALREQGGELDERLDSGSLALAAAMREYAAVAPVADETVDRLVTHVETTLDGLERETAAIRGLVRFEGDDWRQHGQGAEKVWTVSTAWGANAAAELGSLLEGRDDDRVADVFGRSRDLLGEILPGGSLARQGGYLPEQLFDDGTPDSATPLGWPHALRLATVAHLDDVGELRVEAAEATARTE